MKKYFKEEETKKIKLSEYLKMDKSEFQYFVYYDEYRERVTKYIMGIIGDVELDEETYSAFIGEFRCFGGRYTVRTQKETIKGIYEMTQKYPFLSADALQHIWFVYIHDQFEEYALDEALGKYIEQYGKTEEAFLKYIDYVDQTAKEFDKPFYEDAAKISTYCKDYDSDLIKHLQYIIKTKHISLEQVLSALPSRELIDKDKEQLIDISTRTRIYFGACDPVSYQMIERLATGEGLDCYPEQPKYLINDTQTIDATFTKQEFLDSIKERLDMEETIIQKKKKNRK